MYLHLLIFPRTRKKKREIPHDALLLSNFAFEPLALLMARINESSLV